MKPEAVSITAGAVAYEDFIILYELNIHTYFCNCIIVAVFYFGFCTMNYPYSDACKCSVLASYSANIMYL